METSREGTRILLAAALAVALLTAFAGQSDRQIWAPDEAREAGITAAMARTGDWVVPHLNGRPFLEKPPLFHAAGAAVMDATGSRSPFVVRLPAALFALATMAATFLLGRRIGGARLGALAVLALATTAEFHAATHRAVTDNAIPPFVTLAFLGLALLLGDGPPGPALALCGAACGVAFLAKGAVGPALVVAGGAVTLLLLGQGRRLHDPRVVPALLLAVLPGTAWLLLLHGREGWGAVHTILVDNNWGRATGPGADHAAGPFYYLLRAPVALLPWIPLVLLGARRAWRERGLRLLPLAWLGTGLLLLSAVTAKRSIYLLPLVPAAALLAALEIEAWIPRLSPRTVALTMAGVAAVFAAGFHLAAPDGDARRGLDGFVAEVTTRSADRDLVLFRPTEEVEGILSLRLDTEIPAIRSLPELSGTLRMARREVLVVGPEGDPRFREVIASASRTFVVEAAGERLVLAILGPHPMR